MEGNKKILIVEDDVNLSQILKDIFTNSGFYVVVARNGEEALEILKSFKPDIIVADILMPGINGFELFSRIRSVPQFRTVPFVFLTALSDQENRFRGLGLGADDYISKPFNPQELVLRINNILKRHQSMMNTLQGSLAEISLVDVLQLLESRASTGLLSLRFNNGSGEIYLENGQIYHMTFNNLVGREALKEMLKQQGGQFEFIPDVKTDVATLENINTTQLILDVMRELDEELAEKEEHMGLEIEDIDNFSLQQYEPPEELTISPIKVIEGLYWVSSRESGIDSQPNTYLFDCKGTFVLIDPGPPTYFEAIMNKVSEVLKNDLSKLKFIIVTNPLPDQTFNIVRLVSEHPEISILSTFENIRMMAHMGVPKERFKPVDFFKRPVHIIGRCSDEEEFMLRFITTPYCPLRGSMVIGMPSKKLLISGMLFSNLLSTQDEGHPLYAGESDLDGMQRFMKIYIPDREHLKQGLSRIREQMEEIELILPAYGKIFKGEIASRAVEIMENLDVGTDLSIGG